MDQEHHDGLVYTYQAPGEISGDRFETLCALVESGGSVNTKWVRHNLEKAFLIGLVTDKDRIIGCSSLKNPRTEYIRHVKAQCGLDLTGFLERGYTSVLPEYRGRHIASRLLAGLTARIGSRKLYSVVGEDNIGGQKIALNNRTRRVAVYTSEITGKDVGIWMPEWMIDDDGKSGHAG